VFNFQLIGYFLKKNWLRGFHNNNSGLTPEQRISGLTSNFELSTAQ